MGTDEEGDAGASDDDETTNDEDSERRKERSGPLALLRPMTGQRRVDLD